MAKSTLSNKARLTSYYTSVNQESSGKKRNVNRKAHERKKSYRHGHRSIAMGDERDDKIRPAQNPQSWRQKPQNANGIGTDLSNKY